MGVFLEFGKRRIYGHVFLPKSGSAVSLLLFYRRIPIRLCPRAEDECLRVYEEISALAGMSATRSTLRPKGALRIWRRNWTGGPVLPDCD